MTSDFLGKASWRLQWAILNLDQPVRSVKLGTSDLNYKLVNYQSVPFQPDTIRLTLHDADMLSSSTPRMQLFVPLGLRILTAIISNTLRLDPLKRPHSRSIQGSTIWQKIRTITLPALGIKAIAGLVICYFPECSWTSRSARRAQPSFPFERSWSSWCVRRLSRGVQGRIYSFRDLQLIAS